MCEYRTREYRVREYGTREYGRAYEYGTCDYAWACEYTGACEYGREPYSENTYKTSHFALATKRAPSIWIIDSGASHYMYNIPRSWFWTYS